MERPSTSRNNAESDGERPSDVIPVIDPVLPTSNPNISDTPPLLELAQAGGAVLAGFALIYFVLGWTAGWMATKVPDSVEYRWASIVAEQFEADPEFEPQRERLQELVDRLAANLRPRDFPYTVHFVDESTVNAAALPGGRIIIFEGLLDEVESENELAMILSHELIHLDKRHNLKALGRSLAVALAFSAVLGNDSVVRPFLETSMSVAGRGFSRSDESQADRLGLDLVATTYGHVGGAVDFFERHVAEDSAEILEFFETHSLSNNRVEALRQRSEERGYAVDSALPWK